MENDMKMPWPVRIALGWFVLLAVISCIPLVLAVVAWCRDADDYGLGMVCGPFCVALGVGFVLAILWNERDWLAVAYSIVGMLVAFVIFCCVLDLPANMKAVVGLIVTLVVVTTPLVLLYLPSSNRWYASFPRKKRLSAVWCAVMILFGIVIMAAMIYASENSRQKSRPATAKIGQSSASDKSGDK